MAVSCQVIPLVMRICVCGGGHVCELVAKEVLVIQEVVVLEEARVMPVI